MYYFIPDNIYPARGRKHSYRLVYDSQLLYGFPTIFTPQGDGNKTQADILSRESSIIPDNIYPARGRKHKTQQHTQISEDRGIPDNIYPARGRKHPVNRILKARLALNSRQYLPRKGTETGYAEVFCDRGIPFPTIFTPQGDGNNILTSNRFTKSRPIPDNIYPARGRKLCGMALYLVSVLRIPDNIYPARGRKLD